MFGLTDGNPVRMRGRDDVDPAGIRGDRSSLFLFSLSFFIFFFVFLVSFSVFFLLHTFEIGEVYESVAGQQSARVCVVGFSAGESVCTPV